jgi:hypothetical protein
MKTCFYGRRRYELGVGLTILSSSIRTWSMVIFQHLGFQLCAVSKVQLLKLEEHKQKLAAKRAAPQFRTKEYRRRHKKRKNNRSSRTAEESSALPYVNQNTLNDAVIQHIAGCLMLTMNSTS